MAPETTDIFAQLKVYFLLSNWMFLIRTKHDLLMFSIIRPHQTFQKHRPLFQTADFDGLFKCRTLFNKCTVLWPVFGPLQWFLLICVFPRQTHSMWDFFNVTLGRYYQYLFGLKRKQIDLCLFDQQLYVMWFHTGIHFMATSETKVDSGARDVFGATVFCQ